MNPFAEKFQLYLSEKDMKVGDVQRFSGMNLTTLYKLLDGSREPTKLEAVEKIADSLCLNREEREALVESFYLTRLGPMGYYGRKEVRSFYDNLNLVQVEETQPFLPFREIPLEPGESMVLSGQQNVDIALEYFVCRAAKETPGVTVHITEFFENTLTLSIVANISKLYPETKFIHIVRLDEVSSGNVEEDGMLYNVHLLGKVLPFAAHHENYKVLYRYTDVETEKTQLSHLNCLIRAGEYTIQYAPNHRHCIVERNENVSALFEKIAAEEMGSVSRLIYRRGETDRNEAGELQRLFLEPIMGTNGYLYYSGFLTREFYDSPDTRELREFILELAHKIPAIIVPRYLVDHFAADETFAPAKQRADDLEQLLGYSRSKKVRIIDGEESNFAQRVLTAITLSTLYIGVPNGKTDITVLAVTEPTIVHAFYDFVDGVFKQESYSSDKTVQYLKQKILDLRQGPASV